MALRTLEEQRAKVGPMTANRLSTLGGTRTQGLRGIMNAPPNSVKGAAWEAINTGAGEMNRMVDIGRRGAGVAGRVLGNVGGQSTPAWASAPAPQPAATTQPAPGVTIRDQADATMPAAPQVAPAQVPAQRVAAPQGPQVPAGIGEGSPGTGMIKDSTGKVSYMGADGTISSFRPYQEGGAGSMAQNQPTGGLRRAAGNYSFQGSAEDEAKLNRPVFNNATRQVVSGYRTEPAAQSSSNRADEPLANTLGGIVVQGIRAKKDRLYANIANQERLAGLEGRGQDITARGQDLNFASNAEQNAIAADRNRGLNAQADAQGELYGAQVDEARKNAELLDQYQNEPDEGKRKGLRELINLRQGVQEKAPQLHFGETETMTKDGIVSQPYASTVDAQGGFRTLREGGNSLAPAREQLSKQATGLPAPAQEALKKWGAANPQATDEQIAAKINELTQGK